MRILAKWLLLAVSITAPIACDGEDDERADEHSDGASATSAPRAGVEQRKPPIDLARPPADAEKTASGLSYKTLVTNTAGARAKHTDTASVHYTGWIQRTGATFFSTRGRGRPIALDLAHAAHGFAEVVPLLRTGEKAMLWVPPSEGTPEAVVYEIEVTGIVTPVPSAKRDTGRATQASAGGPGR